MIINKKARAIAAVILCLIILRVIMTSLFYLYKVELELVKVVPITEEMFIPYETPIWWIQVNDNSMRVREYLAPALEDMDVSENYIILSWRLPLSRLTYQNISRFSNKYYTDKLVAKAVFKDVEVSEVVYVYRMKKLELVDEYIANIHAIPEVEKE